MTFHEQIEEWVEEHFEECTFHDINRADFLEAFTEGAIQALFVVSLAELEDSLSSEHGESGAKE